MLFSLALAYQGCCCLAVAAAVARLGGAHRCPKQLRPVAGSTVVGCCRGPQRRYVRCCFLPCSCVPRVLLPGCCGCRSRRKRSGAPPPAAAACLRDTSCQSRSRQSDGMRLCYIFLFCADREPSQGGHIVETRCFASVFSAGSEVSRLARIRCAWNQTATATGRLSSSNPNLQAVTKYQASGRAIGFGLLHSRRWVQLGPFCFKRWAR